MEFSKGHLNSIMRGMIMDPVVTQECNFSPKGGQKNAPARASSTEAYNDQIATKLETQKALLG